jgi:DNA-binding transcriptional LysR family regulator
VLHELEYLVALAGERHFGRAATTCHVSQPALSAGLRRLERELGVTIVRRTRRFEGFTPEGERIVTWAHRILAERREMLADIGRFRGRLTATARLGVIPTASGVTPLITEAFRFSHPEALVRILVLPSREISRQLTEFELDAGLTYLDDETPPGTRRLLLYHERFFLLAPADDELARSETVDWADAARLPLCALTSDMRNRRIVEALVAAGGGVFRPIVEANTVGALYVHLGMGGLGAIVTHPWLSAFGVPPGMVAVPMASQPAPAVGMIITASSHTPVLAEALWEAARSADVGPRLDALVTASRAH